MPDLAKLRELREMVRGATGASRRLAAEIASAFFLMADRYTSSIDAVVGLIDRVLPGWAWSCGSCSVSHNATVRRQAWAWLAPDPYGSDAALLDVRRFDNGFDGDRSDGNVPLAMLDSLLSALIAIEEERADGGAAEGSAT